MRFEGLANLADYEYADRERLRAGERSEAPLLELAHSDEAAQALIAKSA